jgi:hypothetical protein
MRENDQRIGNEDTNESISNIAGQHDHTIALDFDGVIHSYTSGWLGPDVIPDPIVPGAAEFIVTAAEYYDIVIYSTRAETPEGRDAMRTWLREQIPRELSWWRDSVDELIANIHTTDRKPPALLYIDDRGFQFQGVFPALEYIENFEPWYTRETELDVALDALNKAHDIVYDMVEVAENTTIQEILRVNNHIPSEILCSIIGGLEALEELKSRENCTIGNYGE